MPSSSSAPRIGKRWFRWQPGQRRTTIVCAVVLAASFWFLVLYLQIIVAAYREIAAVQDGRSSGYAPTLGDFFALWSYARIAMTHAPSELYDVALLHARQVSLGMNPSDTVPFAYPPTALLLFWPLGWLPYTWAFPVWLSATLALFVGAVATTCSRLPVCVAAALIVPATTVNIASGQTGFLTAALMIVGVRLAATQPILSGVSIGLLTYKPQLGVLLPIVLATAGLWTSFAVAVATAIAFAVLATLAFGSIMWADWVAALPRYLQNFDLQAAKFGVMVTVMANLQLAGLDLRLAQAAQLVTAGVVAVLVAICFRKATGRLGAACVLVGTLLATPHAFVYDVGTVTGATALVIEDRVRNGTSFHAFEIAILVLATVFPAFMMVSSLSIPVSAVPLALLFALIVARILRRTAVTGTLPQAPGSR